MGEQAPYTFVTEPDMSRTALSDPDTGILQASEALREAVRAALTMH